MQNKIGQLPPIHHLRLEAIVSVLEACTSYSEAGHTVEPPSPRLVCLVLQSFPLPSSLTPSRSFRENCHRSQFALPRERQGQYHPENQNLSRQLGVPADASRDIPASISNRIRSSTQPRLSDSKREDGEFSIQVVRRNARGQLAQ